MNAAARTTVPMMTGRSCVATDCTASWPSPGKPEDVLDDDHASQQRAQVDAELGDDRRRARCAARAGRRPAAR